jgi:hypothetical protein
MPTNLNSKAFREEALGYIAKPTPRWMEHSSCVWTASTHLKRVVRLVRYKDCRTLFCDYLGVRPAGIQHVVDETSSIADEDPENLVRRFEALFLLLSEFHFTGPQLTDMQRLKIRAATVFPVLAASETYSELRSLEDGDWYIPNITTLQSAFCGRVDLLALSVPSVQPLLVLLEELDCEDMSLSNCVTQRVEPRGNKIRDLRTEKDLKT